MEYNTNGKTVLTTRYNVHVEQAPFEALNTYSLHCIKRKVYTWMVLSQTKIGCKHLI